MGGEECRQFNVCPWERDGRVPPFSCGLSLVRERDEIGPGCVTGDDSIIFVMDISPLLLSFGKRHQLFILALSPTYVATPNYPGTAFDT